MSHERLKERIVKLIESRGRIKKSEISKFIQGSTEEREDALRDLISENVIHSMYGDSTGGRAAIWYSLKEVGEVLEKDLRENERERAAYRHEEKWKGSKQKLLNYIRDFGPVTSTQIQQKYPTLFNRAPMLQELEKENLIWCMENRTSSRGAPAVLYGHHEHGRPQELQRSTEGGWIAKRLWFWIKCPGAGSPQMFNILEDNALNHVVKLTWEDAAGKYTREEIMNEANKIATSREYYEEFSYWESIYGGKEKSRLMKEQGIKLGFINNGLPDTTNATELEP